MLIQQMQLLQLPKQKNWQHNLMIYFDQFCPAELVVFLYVRSEDAGKDVKYMCKLHLRKENKTILAEKGSNLLQALRDAGVEINAPCGGRGVCGKCKVKLYKETEEIVKACETTVESDLELDLYMEEKGYQILTLGEAKAVKFDPELRKTKVWVPECPFGKSISDWTRFSGALQEKVPVRNGYQVNLSAASMLHKLLNKGQGEVWAVTFEDQVLKVSDTEPEIYMAAFDIGTTTVASYLLNGSTGEVVTVSSRRNPQTMFGADVISRANYALEQGMEELTTVIREALMELLNEMAQKAGIEREDIYLISIAGNTCMHHMFLGISVESLVHAPYNPTVSEQMVLKASDYDIRIHPEGRILMLPNIAGFVGADTTACVISSALFEQSEWTLLIDIGTNGEMVLGKGKKMITCSTAAGPAFEGAKISCGMRGAEGAISKVKWADNHWEYETIGNGKAKGLCGSGLLDVAAELLTSGQMDESGMFTDGKEVVLAEGRDSENGEPIVLLQKDIRELQLAKAAIAAGIHLLAERMEISMDEIRNVWIAGAFGSFLSPDSACTIGLIPTELRGRIKPLGNAAGEGAKQVLQNKELWKTAGEKVEHVEFLELASLPQFQDCFVDELEFPEQ